jgi:hypothetical protein
MNDYIWIAFCAIGTGILLWIIIKKANQEARENGFAK